MYYIQTYSYTDTDLSAAVETLRQKLKSSILSGSSITVLSFDTFSDGTNKTVTAQIAKNDELPGIYNGIYGIDICEVEAPDLFVTMDSQSNTLNGYNQPNILASCFGTFDNYYYALSILTYVL